MRAQEPTEFHIRRAHDAEANEGDRGVFYAAFNADGITVTIEPIGAEHWQVEAIAAAINGDIVALQAILGTERLKPAPKIVFELQGEDRHRIDWFDEAGQ